MSKWLVYYKYTDMEGHTVEDNEIISIWANELELNIILKKLKPRTNMTTNIVIMNMIKLK
ncbi:MAG: hypothetical protein ACI3T9_07765 [Romboutsia timonensis]